MLEFGMRLGLAADLQYDKRIQDLRYNEEAMRRAKAEQEAKAKMFADDFSYNNAMNTFDNPKVKEFAQFQIKRIGSFINSNPDWQTNVQKRAEYQMLVRELKDNKDLMRGLQTDEAFKRINEYASDPKNQHIVNSDDWKQVELQKQNYLRFGNQFGEEAAKKDGLQPFQFRPPEEMADYTKYLMEIAKNTSRDGYQSGGGGYGSYKQFVTDASKQGALELAKSHPMYKYLEKDFIKQKEKGMTKAETIDGFIFEKMNPYFPEQRIEKGQYDMSSGRSKGLDLSTAKNPWETMLTHASQGGNKYGVAQVPPEAILNTFANPDGSFDLSRAYVFDNKSGNRIPMNLGVGKAVPKGTVKYIPAGKDGKSGYYTMDAKVRMPLPIFIKKFGEDAIDFKGMAGGLTGQISPSEDTDFDIHNGDYWNKDYTGMFTKVVEGDKKYVEFDTEIPFQNNEVLAARFNNTLGGGKKADAFTSETQQSIPVGRGSDGKLYYIDEQGNPIAEYK